MTDKRLNAKGKLMFSSIRNDSKLMQMYLAGQMPEKYGRDNSGTNITVVIVDVNE